MNYLPLLPSHLPAISLGCRSVTPQEGPCHLPRLGGPQGPAGSSPQPPFCDKAEVQRELGVPNLPQQRVEASVATQGSLPYR